MLPSSIPSRKWTPFDERPGFDHRQDDDEEESTDCKDRQDTPQDRKRFCGHRRCEQEYRSKEISINGQGLSKQLKSPDGHGFSGQCQVPGSLHALWYNLFSFGLGQAEQESFVDSILSRSPVPRSRAAPSTEGRQRRPFDSILT